MDAFSVFWFRRDLRLKDNAGLSRALRSPGRVQPLFIFDTDLLSKLEEKHDARVHFLHETLSEMKDKIREASSELWIRHGRPLDVWKEILGKYPVKAVYANRDNDPAARRRDQEIEDLCRSRGIAFHTFKDQSLFERDEILSGAGTPYTVFTPYKKKVLSLIGEEDLQSHASEKFLRNLRPAPREAMPSLEDLGFAKSAIRWPERKISRSVLENYDKTRDFPGLPRGTSRLGVHLRFGTLSIRELAKVARELNATYLSELLWRDFFMQILWHFPRVEKESFRPAFDEIRWRSSKADFERWCAGETGYPWIDAGMRELNETGFMHNRVRMAAASFLTKHLLIHWREGERYFARKLLDYDLAANNGNWQWAAGSGCDAAPYFRVFNPASQAKKFDPDGTYLDRWVPERNSPVYPKPMVDHDEARGRALSEYSKALKGKKS